MVNKDIIFYHFTDIYQYDEERVRKFFYSTILIDSFFNTISIVVAITAFCRHKITAYKYFSVFYAICIASRIILAYINTWNVIIFILMLFIYTYARYMIALIYGLCLIPDYQELRRNRGR